MGWTFTSVIRPPCCCTGERKPGGTYGVSPLTSAWMPRRARWVAACVLAQGNSGPGWKYWTSSCMYLPDGKVMPAISTWQPVAGSKPSTARPAQPASRRCRACVPLRGEIMSSSLLGRRGGRTGPPAVARPERASPHLAPQGRGPVGSARDCQPISTGLVVSVPSQPRNRPVGPINPTFSEHAGRNDHSTPKSSPAHFFLAGPDASSIRDRLKLRESGLTRKMKERRKLVPSKAGAALNSAGKTMHSTCSTVNWPTRTVAR